MVTVERVAAPRPGPSVGGVLLTQPGIGPITAAQLLITAGDNWQRLHSEAAFAALCGSSPVQASSGKTERHRLNRGGDRQANTACIASWWCGCSANPSTACSRS